MALSRSLSFLSMMTALALATAHGLIGCSPSDSVTFAWRNPNLGLPFRDPHIVPDGGRFWAVGTSEPFWEGKNPGVKLFVSDDLVEWSYMGLLIDASTLPEDVWYTDRFWAPELRHIGSRYFLTFNAQNNSGSYAAAHPRHYHACGVAVAERIQGPYTVLTHQEPLTAFASNDCSLFEDDDGTVYAFFNNGWTDVHHIFVGEMDLETGRLKEEPVRLISQEPGTWDKGGIEGAHVIRVDGVYYMFYSSWTRGYAVGYATSRSVRGPWTKYEGNPLFGAFRDEDGQAFIVRDGEVLPAPDSPFQTVGHNQIFTGPDGRYWTSYHGILAEDGKAGLLIDPIWFEDGVVRTTSPSYTPQTVSVSPPMLAEFAGLGIRSERER